MRTPALAHKPGDLRVWWIPQIPGKTFTVDVPDVETAKLLCNVLADYDQFQLNNSIKPDYCNTGGISVWEPDGDIGFAWFDAYDENGEDIY